MDLQVNPGSMYGVELAGRKFFAEEPTGLGNFLARTTLGGKTLLRLIIVGVEHTTEFHDLPTRESLNEAGGGVGWWWKWPAQK